MSAGLSKLATALTVVFAVSLVVLIADLLYVLWRRRRFRQRSVDPFQPPSKELLYFFCSWKNHSRIEPDAAVDRPDSGCAPPMTVAVGEDEDVAKWQQGVFGHGGPSRFLFTIKEEEKEDLETEKCSSSCEENGLQAKRVSLNDRFETDQADHEVSSVVVEVDDDHAATPFSTPCASPPYYTPSASPSQDDTTSLVTIAIPLVK